MNFLKSVPYITINKEQELPNTPTDWRTLEGKYAGSGITSETGARENATGKARERRQVLQ